MNVVDMVFEKRHLNVMNVNEMQFGFMPKKGTIDVMFVLRFQVEYFANGKNCMFCICG